MPKQNDSEKEEIEFQKGIRSTEWFKEYVKEYKEEPDLNTSDYNYRAAWKAGIRPEKDKYDNDKYHWLSSVPETGEMLKSKDHPTAWKEYYMRETGENPDEKGVTKEQYEESKKPKMATGGQVMKQTQRILAEGGVMQEGGTVDPVSGNAVPPGAMKEEVRDDIDAKLSEGEFIFPADVVRYFGLQKLMAMRDEAKMGLQKMNDIGQMGNADQVSNPEALYSAPAAPAAAPAPDFGSEVDMALAETGSTEQAFAYGGTPDATQAKTDTYVNQAGQKIYVPMSNGNPIIDIPMGFNKQEETMAQPAMVASGLEETKMFAGGLAKKRKKK